MLDLIVGVVCVYYDMVEIVVWVLDGIGILVVVVLIGFFVGLLLWYLCI